MVAIQWVDRLWALLTIAVLSLPAILLGQEGAGVWPREHWETAGPEEAGMDSTLLVKARDYAWAAGGSGLISRHGKVVMRWGDQRQTYDLKSSTKAIGVTAVGLALLDGKFKSLDDPATQYHPALGVPPESNRGKGWLEKITLFHLATQTAGFDKNGGYTEPLFEPGTKWSYSDGGPNWLAECVTLAYRRDLQDLMFERVFMPLGIGRDDLQWRANSYRPRGLYDSLIVVIPSLDIVVARTGKSLTDQRASHYAPLAPFFEPIALSIKDGGRAAPYPPSTVIRGVEWAPPETILRRAKGSDNWPITWADDALYTAYGDGEGFAPGTEEKLGLGLARILGGPSDFHGVNIRSKTGERRGEGADSPKASGMICVDGALYMLVRNVGNSQIVWSDDHAANWNWCDWKFATSFGAPTFLNFGRNNAGRRDDFVYLYSHDDDSAYAPADRMVLARVPLDRIRDRKAYEFLKSLDDVGRPTWTRSIHERGAVFTSPQRCWRSGISYNAGLKRYLWCQILPFSTDPRGPRFHGGFGIYEAPEPWGPWRTVFYTQAWDVGPGETSSFPTKWMSPDGRTCHLVFSGNDSFSVRQVRFHTDETTLP